MKENKDYLLLPDPEDDQAYAVRILTGEYIGVIFKFNQVQILEDHSKEEATVNFTYDIIKQPMEFVHDNDKLNFEQCISKVLHDIMYNASQIDAVEYKDENGEPVRNYHPPKPNTK